MTSTGGWDSGRVYYNNTLNVASDGAGDAENVLQSKCLSFLEHFRIDNQFIYRYSTAKCS
jgi:hypothetical protein